MQEQCVAAGLPKHQNKKELALSLLAIMEAVGVAADASDVTAVHLKQAAEPAFSKVRLLESPES